ncbi:MAG TPA: DUF547 domain-containing protein [Candidatus Eisenbacteria bacterium]|jgi:hypothetical protein
MIPRPGLRNAPSRGSIARRLVLAAALALAPAAALAASADSTASPAAVDLSGYQQLLNDLLTVVSSPGAAVDTRFDYEKLYDIRGRFERLFRIHRQLLAVPPSRMDDRTRLAWAINTYNFLVIQYATNYLLVPQRGRLRYLSPRDIGLPGGSFFTAPVVEVEGRKYSLDQFEREFLFAGYDRAKGGDPPPALDPRVHFAIVCGAVGCPPLLPRAYKPDSLERQLEFATRNALALPRHLTLSEQTGRLDASAIFQWYTADFGGMERAFEFVRKYAPARTRAAIEKRKLNAITGMTPWDWNLNQFPHKKVL